MEPLVDLTTNVSQIFTELYEKYSLLNNLEENVFENALYLEGRQALTIKDRMDSALKTYHQNEGTLSLYINPNEDLSDQVFVAGNGSTQIYKGLVYALSRSYPDKDFLFVQKIPYFSGHREAVNSVFDYPNATYQGYNDPSEVNPDPGVIIVEFVTSPNNPDGKFRKPQFKNTDRNPYIILGDFVFTSSSFGDSGDGYIPANLKWLEEYRNDGTLILSYNSASKQFGHTGDRYGYMWFPLYDEFAAGIYNELHNFLSITVGSNLFGAANFLNLLLPLEKYGKKIRYDANESLKLRSKLLFKALKQRYPNAILSNVPGSPTMFVQINDPRVHLPEITASDVILEDTNVKTVPGSSYGSDDSYVRINIMAYSEDLAIFSNRLGSLDSFDNSNKNKNKNNNKRDDFILSKGTKPAKTIISNKRYVVNPNDRCLSVDAYHNDIVIYLPKFLGYEPPMKLCIKRIDNGCNKVKVKSDDFSIKLSSHDLIALKWSQPFYQNGSWEILKSHKFNGKSSKRRESNKTNESIKTNKYDVSHLYLV